MSHCPARSWLKTHLKYLAFLISAHHSEHHFLCTVHIPSEELCKISLCPKISLCLQVHLWLSSNWRPLGVVTLVSDLIKTWKVWTQQSVCTAWHLTRLLCAFRCITWESTEAGLQFLSCKHHKVTFLFSPKFLSKKKSIVSFRDSLGCSYLNARS